jgi:hypothetical protein
MVSIYKKRNSDLLLLGVGDLLLLTVGDLLLLEHLQETLYVISTLSSHVESFLLFFEVYSNRLSTLSLFLLK